MRYLLDTNIISNVVKPQPAASLLAWLGEQWNGDLFIASLTVAEIHRGILETPRGKKRAARELYQRKVATILHKLPTVSTIPSAATPTVNPFRSSVDCHSRIAEIRMATPPTRSQLQTPTVKTTCAILVITFDSRHYEAAMP
jgi:hypothetical protein